MKQVIKTAYVSGALTGLPKDVEAEMKRRYETIGKVCTEHGIDPYVPHVHSDPDKHPHFSPTEVYEMDTKEVLARDLLIVEATHPSLGAGGEAVHASLNGKWLVVCYQKGARVSRYLRGIPGIHAEIAYASTQDLRFQLKQWLEHHGD